MIRARAATTVAILATLGCKGESARRDDAAGLHAGADATVAALRARPQSPLGASVASGFDAVSDGFSPRFAASAGRVSARAVLPARASGAIHLEDAASGARADVSLDGARDVAAQASGGYVVYPGAHGSGATLLHRPIPTGAPVIVTAVRGTTLAVRPAYGSVMSES